MSRLAPPPSRFKYDFIVDPTTLPSGVTCETIRSASGYLQNWIKNSSEIPFQCFENDYLGRTILGFKLVDNKVYVYYPNGIPIVGKTHIKGWVLWEHTDRHLLSFDGSLMAIYNAQQPGLPVTTPLPPDEIVTFLWDFGGREWTISGTIVYAIDENY
jgi:hypothetical protein